MTVSITFSHDDGVNALWTGVGRPLTAYECDLDLYNLKTAVETLQDNYSATISIATVTQPASNSMRVTLTDATYFDLTLPIGRWRSRGDWAVSTAYLVDDIFNAPDGGLYQAIFDHTSDDTEFDPNANDGMGHDYYFPLIPARGNALPAGGSARMSFKKSTGVDYAVTWGFDIASDVIFTPSTASSLASDNVADALEELEGLIADVTGSLVVDAADVTFTPSTGSALTSSNVADALEELEANISAPVGYLPLAGGTMTGTLTLVGDPASAFQAATKQYVDGIALNLGKRQTVRVATTANIVIASALNSGDTIDGVTLATNDLVLVKNQSTPAQNGVYVVDVSPIRSVEFNTYDEHPGALIAVQEGTAGADSIWLCTANAGGTLNTTPITFSQSSTSGALLAGNNLSDVPNPTLARANLGIIEDLAGLSDVDVTEGAGIDGYSLTWNNGTGKWEAELAAGATYSAGAGLDLTGTTFSLGPQTGGALVVIDGGGSEITTGIKGYLGPIPFGGTITEATLLADQSGSIIVDIWKCTYSQFDAGSTHPVSGDKITASAPPTITTATKSQDSTLTGWTTTFSAGDVLAFNVNSVTDIERVTLSLKFTK